MVEGQSSSYLCLFFCLLLLETVTEFSMRAVVLCTLLAVASANPLRAAMRHMQQMGGPGMEINEEQIKAQVVQTLQKIPLFKSVPAEGIQEFFTILFVSRVYIGLYCLLFRTRSSPDVRSTPT